MDKLNKNKESEFSVNQINSVIIYNGIEYDLSTLEGANAYFSAKGELATLQQDYNVKLDINLINKSIKNIESKQPLLTNPSSIAAFDVQITSRTSAFDLESKCRENAIILKNIYKSYYNMYIRMYNPIKAAAQAYLSTGVFFASMEKKGGPWDLKTIYNLKYTTYYDTKINGKILSLLGDDIGNIHYGYVGKAMFPSFILKSLAGMAQISGGNYKVSWFTSYFDDPRDQLAIQRGIDYYDSGTFE